MSTTMLARVRAYLESYVAFADPDQSLAVAIWAVGTYLWPHFDAFPYLVVTSDTKQSGKTRLSELVGFVASNARAIAGATAATLFRMIRDEKPTLIIDEAETLASESASAVREVLNVGYRRGQTIPRIGRTTDPDTGDTQSGVVQWPTYCPKVFVLIGDVYDTLRDRSVIIRMRRATPRRRFVYTVAQAEGAELGADLKAWADDLGAELADRYARHPGLPFLPDRDAEIWTPLVATCELLAPDVVDTLKRVAVDTATEKTAPARKHSEQATQAAERDAFEATYGERLVLDLLEAFDGFDVLYSADALARLYAMPLAPWRRFRGDGLDPIMMARMLRPFGVTTRLIRTNGKRPTAKVARGYRKVDVEKAAAQLRH